MKAGRHMLPSIENGVNVIIRPLLRYLQTISAVSDSVRRHNPARDLSMALVVIGKGKDGMHGKILIDCKIRNKFNICKV